MFKKLIILSLLVVTALYPAQAKLSTQQQNFKTAMRGFYLTRCGTAVEGDYKSDHFSHKACHLQDGYTDYVGKKGAVKDGTGGWHDAGDFGKYTVNAGITMGILFYAWDHFQKPISKVGLDIPQTAPGFPDFLKELKWETDFLLKMQYPDGSGRVSHKLTALNFSKFMMPETDPNKRYFSQWSSTATADFVAVMAMAARYFEPYDKEYAKKCLDAARLSYKYLTDHPEYVAFEQGDFSTGPYISPDSDDRFWAAAELWETTGDPDILKYVEHIINVRSALVASNWDWNNVVNLGLWTYALSNRQGRNPQMVEKVVNSIMSSAAEIASQMKKDKYGYPLADYFWGCNGAAARTALNLHVAELLGSKSYKKELKKLNNLILGKNYYKRSYVTGLGKNPPMHPHDSRSGADNVENPWPGYLVGGGHTATDWKDDAHDATRNEIAINWQASLVYLFATQLK